MVAPRMSTWRMNDRGRGAAPRFQHSELALALRAGRALDASPTTRGRTPAVFLFSAILLGLLHTAAVTRFPSYPVGATASAAFGAGNEDVSMQFKKMAAVVSSALAVSAGAHAQDAVQWRVEDGGNGHWYQFQATLRSWVDAQIAAEAQGGYLVTITTRAEGAFLGGTMGWANFWGGATDLADGWRWVTGEPWSYAPWNCQHCHPSCQPDYSYEHMLEIMCWDGTDIRFNNWSQASLTRSVVEYSADCNADGIVDYGQIRAGELVDANANNIPDCCEQGVSCAPCPGDVDESGTVNGVDLAAILAVWGSDGGKYPRADTNNDGEVNGADLATVLGSWGSCE